MPYPIDPLALARLKYQMGLGLTGAGTQAASGLLNLISSGTDQGFMGEDVARRRALEDRQRKQEFQDWQREMGNKSFGLQEKSFGLREKMEPVRAVAGAGEAGSAVAQLLADMGVGGGAAQTTGIAPSAQKGAPIGVPTQQKAPASILDILNMPDANLTPPKSLPGYKEKLINQMQQQYKPVAERAVDRLNPFVEQDKTPAPSLPPPEKVPGPEEAVATPTNPFTRFATSFDAASQRRQAEKKLESLFAKYRSLHQYVPEGMSDPTEILNYLTRPPSPEQAAAAMERIQGLGQEDQYLDGATDQPLDYAKAYGDLSVSPLQREIARAENAAERTRVLQNRRLNLQGEELISRDEANKARVQQGWGRLGIQGKQFEAEEERNRQLAGALQPDQPNFGAGSPTEEPPSGKLPSSVTPAGASVIERFTRPPKQQDKTAQEQRTASDYANKFYRAHGTYPSEKTMQLVRLLDKASPQGRAEIQAKIDSILATGNED